MVTQLNSVSLNNVVLQDIINVDNFDIKIKNDLELIYFYLKNKEVNSLETVRVYAAEIKAFLDFIKKCTKNPEVKLADVTATMCFAYREKLIKEGYEVKKPNGEEGEKISRAYAPATITRKLYIISSLYKFGNKVEYLKTNPMSAVDKPKVRITSQQRYLTPDEVEALLGRLRIEKQRNKDVKFRNYIIAALFLTSGLRAAELASIRWNMFFEDINNNIGLRVIGKGNELREVKVRRDVWSYIQQYRIFKGANPNIDSNDNSPLFLNRSGEALSDRYCREMLKRAAKRAGIKKNISCHWLRHTSASLAVVGGANIEQLLEQYGWSNIKTAQRYIHDTQKLNDTAADRIKVQI